MKYNYREQIRFYRPTENPLQAAWRALKAKRMAHLIAKAHRQGNLL